MPDRYVTIKENTEDSAMINQPLELIKNTPVEKGFLPRIGAQFFCNPEDTQEDIEKHFSLMQQYGIRLMRLFILWDHVEPKPGEWNFSQYDALYDQAALHGIRIVSTLTAEDPPSWFEEKLFYHHYADLNRGDIKEAAARYIEKTVSRYYRHPAHYAWILMNEPELLVNQNEETINLFRQWLSEKYDTIDALNQKWYRTFSDFSEVSVNLPQTPEYWQCFAAFADWHAFLKDNLCSQLLWIRDMIREIDPVSPTHINPKGFFGNLAPVGQDYFKEGDISDILGASIHPAWKFLWFQHDEYGLAFSFCTDLIRSAAHGKSFWITELQAGPTIMTGVQPYTPSPKELTAWLWDAIGAGAKAIVYWMWHPRTFGQEAGEWGIVSANHKVSKRLLASSDVSGLLEANSCLFANAQPIPAQTAIFYNHATEVLSLIEGSPLYRTQEAPLKSMCGVYQALAQAQIPVDFFTEEDIRSGSIKRYKVLYFPYAYALDNNLQQKLLFYVKNGGNIWAEAPFAEKNSIGEILSENEALYEAFGMDILEFQGYPQQPRADIPYLCCADFTLKGANVKERFPDGNPFILQHGFGNGRTCFVNSTVSLGYFNTHLPAFKEAITSLAEECVIMEISILTKPGVISRLLQNEEKRILILENWSDEEAHCIVRGNQKTIQDFFAITPESRFNRNDNQINIQLAAKESSVFCFRLFAAT